MADFLGNLAARSLGQLATVQPRRASPFEADEALPGEILDIAEFESLTEPSASTTAPPPRPPREPRLSGPSDPSERDREMLSSATVQETLEVDDPRAMDGTAEQPPSRTESSPVDPRARVAPGENHPPPDAGASVPRLDVEINVEQAGKHPPEPVTRQDEPARSEWPQADRAPVSDEPAAGAAISNVPGVEIRHVAPQPTGAEQAAALQLDTRIALPEEESPSVDQRPGGSAAPAVTVSIGRIEVKSAPAPEPVRPAARAVPARPGMSLGEYLERSRKGRR